MDEGPDQEAMFDIEGPDEDGCVWIRSAKADDWCHNMGPADKVAEVLSKWLSSIDDGKSSIPLTQDE